MVKAVALASATQDSTSSDSYSPAEVESLAEKLKGFRNNLQSEQQRELLDHLIAGAESFFEQETKGETVIVLDKPIKDAAISALKRFINT
ncbi:MAG: hypothetical protein M3299_11535, partial [Thermoproteota archaeon]|nr:hypothetical protein [Thermoproteota archaeon]